MQYGGIPTWTYGINWQGLRIFEAQWVWLGLVSREWLGSWLDPHVLHVDQWCSLGNGPYPCRRSIFPSWRIACAAARCAESVEYVVSVQPKSCCKLEYHTDTPLQNYWWMVAGYHPSTSWKWLVHCSNQWAWPTIQKGLPLTWRQSSIHMSILSRLGDIHTSDQSYWSIWPPWVDQGGRRLGESGTGFWLWFYSESGNQYKVDRFHLSSVLTGLGSHKVMRWGGCAPCGAVLGSVAWSPHSLTKIRDRLAH